MLRGWAGVLIGLALTGCTRPNPAYDSGSEETGGGETQGSQTSGGVTSVPLDTGSDGRLDTSSGDGVLDSTTDGDTADTGAVCEYDQPVPYSILEEATNAPLGCEVFPFDEPSFGFHVITSGEDSIFGWPCEACPCDEPGGTRLNFDAPLPPIPDGVCVDIHRALSDSGCELLGYAIEAVGTPEGDRLIAMAANVLDPGEALPVTVELGMPLDECGVCPGDDLGDHVLDLFGNDGDIANVTPGTPAPLGDLEVINEASFVNPACDTVVRWHARLLPPMGH